MSVNDGQSTLSNNDTITSRNISEGSFPICGESFFEKSPPVSHSKSLLQTSKASNCISNKNNMLQSAKDSRIVVNPVSTTWKTSTPIFHHQVLPDIIDINDSPFTGCNQSKPRTPMASNSLRCEAMSTMGKVDSNARSSNVGPSKIPPKKIGNSLPDDGYRSKCMVLYSKRRNSMFYVNWSERRLVCEA